MTVDNTVSYGDWVRELRVTGLQQTQEELGEAIGVHSVTVERWERGITLPFPFIQKELRKMAEQIQFSEPPVVSRRIGPKG